MLSQVVPLAVLCGIAAGIPMLKNGAKDQGTKGIKDPSYLNVIDKGTAVASIISAYRVEKRVDDQGVNSIKDASYLDIIGKGVDDFVTFYDDASKPSKRDTAQGIDSIKDASYLDIISKGVDDFVAFYDDAGKEDKDQGINSIKDTAHLDAVEGSPIIPIILSYGAGKQGEA